MVVAALNRGSLADEGRPSLRRGAAARKATAANRGRNRRIWLVGVPGGAMAEQDRGRPW